VAVRGIMTPEAGQTLITALEPLARPADAADTRSGGQRTADALAELARRQLERGQLPVTGGVRPQLSVIVDLPSLGSLPSLDGQPGRLGGELGRLGGEIGWAGPLDPEASRRLACDATLTRVVVSRQPWTPVPTATATTPRTPPPPAWKDCCGRCWPSSPRSWAAPPADPWTSAGPPGSSLPPSGRPWPSATVAVSCPAVVAPWPGAKAIMSGIGWLVAPPTWTTWPWSAGPIIGPCMRAAGDSSAAPTASSAPPHHTENTRPPDKRGTTDGQPWSRA
jgi:hypothetical protein